MLYWELSSEAQTNKKIQTEYFDGLDQNLYDCLTQIFTYSKRIDLEQFFGGAFGS